MGQFDSDHLDFGVVFGGTWWNIQVSQSDFILNNFHHIVMVIDKVNSKYQLYFDNNLYGEVSISGDFAPANCNIMIGRAFDGSDRYWNGLIDTFEVYNFPLTANDVDLLFNINPTIKYNKYYTDISSLNLSTAPIKIHKLSKVEYKEQDSINQNTPTNIYIKENTDDKNPITSNNKIVVYNKSDGYKTLSPLIITKTKYSYNTLIDIFGDGSCKFFVNFENGSNDLTGIYTATWGGNEQYTDGIHGKCALFDGSSYIDYSNQGLNALFQGNFSMSLFFYHPGPVDDELFSRGSDYTRIELINSTTIGIDYVSHTDHSYSIGYDYSKRWNHLVFTIDYDNNIGQLYLNGSFIGSDSLSSYQDSDTIRFGQEVPVGQNVSAGTMMDTIRMFNKVLTADEVSFINSFDGSNYISKNINISSLNLTETPKKYYFISSKSVISFKENENESNLTNIEYDIELNDSTDSELVIVDNTEKYKRIDKFDTDDTFDNIVTSKDNYNYIPSDNNIYFHLKFEDNLDDSSPNSLNSSSIIDTVTYNDSGYVNKCVYFNGGYITLPELDFKSGNWCISVVFKFEDINNMNRIFDLGSGQANNNIMLFTSFFSTDKNYLCFSLFDGGTENIILRDDTDPKIKVFDNKWYHFIANYNSATSEVSIYLNNIYILTKSITISTDSMTSNFLAHSNWSGESNSSGLYIDEFRIYNDIVDTNEIFKLCYENKNYFKYSDNLTHSFNFDNNIYNESGLGNLSLTTGTEQYEENDSKQFLKFDGNTYYTSSDIDLSGESIVTVSFLLMLYDVTINSTIICIGSSTSDGINITYLGDSDPNQSFGINTYNTDIWGISNASNYLGNLNHYVIEIHSGDISSTRIWINGIEYNTYQAYGSSENRNFSSGFRLGGSLASGISVINGIMRNLRIYSGSMESNINDIYKDGLDFYKYKLTLQNNLINIPNKIYIKPNITHLLEIGSLLSYDSSNDIVEYSYKQLEPIYTGRSFQLKHLLSNINDEYYGCNINFWKVNS